MASYRIIDELVSCENEVDEPAHLLDEKADQIGIINENRPLNKKFNKSVTAVESFLKRRKFVQVTKRERTVQRLNSELLSAIENGDFVSFNNSLNEGANINATCTKGGLSTCHVAVIFDKCDLLVELLNKGANYLTPTWQNGSLPVHFAAYTGCLTCLKTLVERHPQSICEQTTSETNEPDGNVLMLDSWVHEHNKGQSKIPQITPGSTPLHVACKQLHVHCVEFLLGNHPNLEIVDHRNRTALDVVNENIVKMKIERFKCLADSKSGSRFTLNSKLTESFASSLVSVNTDESKCCTKITKIICKLIDAGAKITISDENLQNCTTLLHTAVITHNETLLKILLKKNADLTVRNELGDIPLHLAIRNRAKRCFIMLLSWDEKRNTIAVRDHENKTPLQIAICTGWSYGVCLLMEMIADLHVITDEGDSVLHLGAVVENHGVIAQLLSCPEMSRFINMKNNNEETPLMLAVLHGNLSCAKKLIKFGANLRITGKNNRTLVHAAAEKGHTEILQLLLNLDVVLIHAKTDDGETALHLASLEGHLKCVQILIRKGCDMNCKTMKVHDKKTIHSVTSIAESYDFSGTPLHCAAWKGHLSVVQYLIEQNDKLVNEPNINGWYPLHIAAYFNHVECVEYMIKRGANLSRKVLYFDGNWKPAINIVTYSFADSISFFQNIFDSYIFTNDLPLNHPECVVTFNFKVFTPCGDDQKQMKVLNALLNTDNDTCYLQTTLLLHPLTELFLHLKWKKLSKFFVALTILHAIFTLSLTSFALLVREGQMEKWQAVPVFIMLISLVLLSLQEILHASKLQRYYVTDLESWIKWSTFLTAFIVSVGGVNSMFNQNADVRWKSVIAIPVLLSWIEILFLLSRFPVWGFYVLMFFRVTSNVIKVFCTFASLIFGFVFSFFILFKSNETEFYSIWETFVKVIAMMSEFNYSETFKTPVEMSDSETPLFQIVSRLVFLLFVVLVAIVLMNLMIGLAVSDISILEAQGKSQRAAKQIDFLHLHETFVYSETVLEWLPDRVREHVRKNRQVSEAFRFYPGKPYGSEFHRLPGELKKLIMKYLLERKANQESYNKPSKPEKKAFDGKTLSDRLLIISDELDAIKREFYEKTS